MASIVREDVGVSHVIWRLGTPFTVHHDFLPRMVIRRLHWDLVLFGRTFSKPYTCQTSIRPFSDVILHMIPPDQVFNQSVSLVGIPMRAEHSDMSLQEHPPLPSHVSSGISVRNHWNPQLGLRNLARHQLLQHSIWRNPKIVRQSWEFGESSGPFFVRSLSSRPVRSQSLAPVP